MKALREWVIKRHNWAGRNHARIGNTVSKWSDDGYTMLYGNQATIASCFVSHERFEKHKAELIDSSPKDECVYIYFSILSIEWSGMKDIPINLSVAASFTFEKYADVSRFWLMFGRIREDLGGPRESITFDEKIREKLKERNSTLSPSLS